jgi:hypothetical protein
MQHTWERKEINEFSTKGKEPCWETKCRWLPNLKDAFGRMGRCREDSCSFKVVSEHWLIYNLGNANWKARKCPQHFWIKNILEMYPQLWCICIIIDPLDSAPRILLSQTVKLFSDTWCKCSVSEWESESEGQIGCDVMRFQPMGLCSLFACVYMCFRPFFQNGSFWGMVGILTFLNIFPLSICSV